MTQARGILLFSPMSFTGIRFCAFGASCTPSGGIRGFCKRKKFYTFFDKERHLAVRLATWEAHMAEKEYVFTLKFLEVGQF